MKNQVVIVPVHNQLSFLKKCIDSVIKNTEKLKLVIVDDGSTDDDTVKWINAQKKNIFIHVLRNEKAQGFSKACNLGIDYAMQNFDFTCLCLLNSDTEIIMRHWFTRVEKEFENKKIGVAGVMSDNAVAQTVYNVAQYLKEIDKKGTFSTVLVHGFCYFIGRNFIENCGRFDEDLFPHYGSEDDLSMRSVKNGYMNIIVGSVLVKHNAGTSYGRKTREQILKSSVPALLSRWHQSYVDSCIQAGLKIQQILNSNGK